MDALRLLSRSTGLRPQNTTSRTQHVPSEGQTLAPEGQELYQGTKRKRDSDNSAPGNHADVPDEQIRKLQNNHKVRIVDLRKFRLAGSSESRKQQKEISRLFPQPLTSFNQLQSRYSVVKALSENVLDQGYYTPTEVQLATLPLLLSSSSREPDLLTIAPTGSGKTLAFLIPLIQKIYQSHQQRDENDRYVSAIIVAPTKELVGQIVNEGRKLATRTGVTITAIRKRMRLTEQQTDADVSNSSDEEGKTNGEKMFAEGIVKTDILVTTPLSLVHSLGRDEDKQLTLPNVTTLVLDEADVLLDPLFRAQTLEIWSACVSPNLRTSLWSATIGSNIEELAVDTITLRQKTLHIKPKPPLLRTVVGLKDSSLPSINHKLIYAATEPGKLLGLRQLLHPSRPHAQISSKPTTSTTSPLRPPFLIFTQTIARATDLHHELRYDIPAAAGGSTRIEVLHSSLSSTQRDNIMKRFRKGEIWILITTDLLSRGVDFRGINGVVNYDIPTTAAAYIHRAGRTGRAGREGGMCVTFYTREDVKYVKGVANVIAASQKSGPENGTRIEGLEKWVLEALPDLSKKDKRELKERGVVIRRGVKESDDSEEKKKKRKARIGTKSGYEKKLENNRKGAVLGSQKRKEQQERRDEEEEAEDAWGGLSD